MASEGELACRLYDWVTNEMHFYPQGSHASIPKPEQLKLLCRGPCAPIWQWVIKHIRSTETVKTVTGNLALKNKSSSPQYRVNYGVGGEQFEETKCALLERRAALSGEVTTTLRDVGHFEHEVERITAEVTETENKYQQLKMSINTSRRKAALLTAYCARSADVTAQYGEYVNVINTRVQDIKQRAQKTLETEEFYSREVTQDEKEEEEQTSALETASAKHVRESCELIGQFLQDMLSGTFANDKSLINKHKEPLWQKVEHMCGTFSADQVMTGLLTYTSDTTSRLRTLTARVDIRRDAQALRFRYDGGEMKDLANQPSLYRSVHQLLQERNKEHFLSFIQCQKSQNDARNLEQSVAMVKSRIDKKLEKVFAQKAADLKLARPVRTSACEQFFLMATKCSSSNRPVVFFITLLFTVLSNLAKENATQACEYFQLLCKLLNYACSTDVNLPNAEVLLNNEITWLKRVRDEVVNTGETQTDDTLLEGHLGITRELLAFQSADKKYQMGSEKGGANLVKELVEDFVFPASKIVLHSRKMNGEFPTEQAMPVCNTPSTVIAAYDLLVALCTGCVPNLQFLSSMLIDMYYNGEAPLAEWEYLPPVGSRPVKGFVGLKNAGATCYMNSVLQQLFMIEKIRAGILTVEGAADDIEEDFSSIEKGEGETNVDASEEERKDEGSNKDEGRLEYHFEMLKQTQLIFGNLASSKLQYYVPRGFWKHFKLWGEPVNLREQHDALEFFNSLVDSLDEALKALGQPQCLQKELGGSFADQKICKDCPHRYQREEPFTSLNVDIRNHHNLFESLEQYVKGDLLEGANAYHCDKCNKKVDTVKRLVIRKLPKILAIQLKRFDYDWERESAIKFNDYFEFSREFDMEPYTVQGLAKIEGEIIDTDCDDKGQSTKYRLIGVVVHSGQASGGHYYSYIYHRQDNASPKWYKFDDGEVFECKMEDDEEMKNQCFGGEFMGEVFDHMLKRMTYRRQKRWWNAYILFYERVELEEDKLTKNIQSLTISNKSNPIKMPQAIEKCVRKQNIMFMHEKTQFCSEYFQFMKKLLTCNQFYTHGTQDKLSPEAESLAMLSTELASKFLFNVGFHTKKTLRGSATEWYEALTCYLRSSKKVRNWFAQHVMFSYPGRFAEYLLECPSTEVRNAFGKVVVCLAHFSLSDGPCPPPLVQGLYGPGQPADPNATLADHLLFAVLNLLKKEVSEHGRHLQQYFHLFLMYSNLGVGEKLHLLKLSVPAKFMMVALDEGPGPPIKYQYAELSKLHSVVSQLVRCCDISSKCTSSVQNQEPLPNPYGDQILMPIQAPVTEILIDRTSYVKKLLEDCNNSDDTTKLLRYCCWENPHFSSTVLSELLWQVAYSYTYELRPYLDLLLQMLLLEDSWQNHRIHNALKGIPDDRDGLLDTIQRSKSHYQKRAYQCIKMMVALFMHCPPAAQMLLNNGDLKRKWTWAVEWLNDELERRPYPGNAQYTYNNWSPQAQSNETSNGYFLERSQSARVTLAKAIELCPEEDPEDAELTDDQDTSHTREESVSPGGTGEETDNAQTQKTTDKKTVQNNQLPVSGEKTQPTQPNNQINNQLNSNVPSTSEQAPPENSETGEEEHKKDENKIIEGLKDKESDIPTEKEIFVTKQTSKDVKAASTKDKGKPV
ncbi:probable ubiquitin carboxyl-terminal hydrolase FAF-X [Dreissena polymorpha]|uniref:probable ubiquitin carboxyl-terminal hydrolase FAF-X n=1 Tax=Dreissena polymorpha TaxID=45954 RepID=UPI002264A20A|nr:probable ubiquitin carboxyl-terminal hydrolase FAF-X [Dreissena polymorpha]